VYFESTHEYLIYARTSTPIKFSGCSIMGWRSDSGPPIVLAAYSFDVDSGTLLQMGPNYWHQATTAPANTQLLGYNVNLSATIAAVASASTITLPAGQSVVQVTGTTNITSITAAATDVGRVITLLFADVLTVTDGSNLKLNSNSNFVTSADDTMSLLSNGTNWYEISRSAN
jgi:hypothetical protein